MLLVLCAVLIVCASTDICLLHHDLRIKKLQEKPLHLKKYALLPANNFSETNYQLHATYINKISPGRLHNTQLRINGSCLKLSKKAMVPNMLFDGVFQDKDYIGILFYQYGAVKPRLLFLNKKNIHDISLPVVGDIRSISARLQDHYLDILLLLENSYNHQTVYQTHVRLPDYKKVSSLSISFGTLYKKVCFLEKDNVLALTQSGHLIVDNSTFSSSHATPKKFNDLVFTDIAVDGAQRGHFIALTTDYKIIYVNLYKKSFYTSDGKKIGEHKPRPTYKTLCTCTAPAHDFIHKIWFNNNLIRVFEGPASLRQGAITTYKLEHVLATLSLNALCNQIVHADTTAEPLEWHISETPHTS